MEKIPPEEIVQLLENFHKKAMIALLRDFDLVYSKDIEMFTKMLKNTNAKEEQWEVLQVLKDFHKDIREAQKDLNFTSCLADMAPLEHEEGITAVEFIQVLREYKNRIIDRADREQKKCEEEVMRMMAKVREEHMKAEISRFVGAPPETAKAKYLRRIKELNQECDADGVSDKGDLRLRTLRHDLNVV